MTDEFGRALVTGASSGIGAAFAEALAAGGSDLVLTARRVERLEGLAAGLRDAHGVRVELLPADLAREEGLAAVRERLEDDRDPVRLLVNNAGRGSNGPFDRLDAAGESQTVSLNVTAVLALCHAHLGALRRRGGGGGVINVASLAAFQAMPAMATYAASKAFVVSLSESLAEWASRSGITVQALCPGFVRTEFAASNGLEEQAGRIPRFAWMEPQTVVAVSLAAYRRGGGVVVPGIGYRVLAGLSRTLPRPAARKLMEMMT